MRLSRGLGAGVLFVSVAATGAAAAPAKPKPPPPACNLVKDPKGDSTGKVQGVDVFGPDESLDIVSADLATGAKTVTAVVKVAAGSISPSPLYAKRYIVEFAVAGLTNKAVLAAAVGVDATTYNYGYYAETATGGGYTYPGAATGSVSGDTVKITANLADLAADTNIGVIKKGAKISAIKVVGTRRLPGATSSPRGQLVGADEALGKTPYAAGAPHCLKPL